MHENDSFAISLTADRSKIMCRKWAVHSANIHVRCGWYHTIRTQTSLDTTLQILFHEWERHNKEKHNARD